MADEILQGQNGLIENLSSAIAVDNHTASRETGPQPDSWTFSKTFEHEIARMQREAAGSLPPLELG